jgi:hypothetical protein
LYRAVGCGKETHNGRQSRGLNTTNLKGQFKKGGDRTFSEKWRGKSGSHSPQVRDRRTSVLGIVTQTKEVLMKSIRRIAGILTLLTLLMATQAMAEKFVVGYQPYDTISYQAIINAELGLWKKYVPKGTEIEFQGALQGTVVANNMLADKAHVGYMSVMPATILCSKPRSRWSPPRACPRARAAPWCSCARTPRSSKATRSWLSG